MKYLLSGNYSLGIIVLFSIFFVRCTDHIIVSPEVDPENVDHLDRKPFSVLINGNEIPVDTCRVSAMPVNMYWNGLQRPLDQTESAYFASCDIPGDGSFLRISVISGQPISEVVINPGSYEINHTIRGDTISFEMSQAGSVTVEVNGIHHVLHLFVNYPEKKDDIPFFGASGVLYFGPGIHYPGSVQLQSNESVYIAKGAVVFGRFWGYEASNIRIYGRGIIDGSRLEQSSGHILSFTSCSNVGIEGIVMRDPASWCCAFFGCKNLSVSNVKIIGLWRYNSDGIDVCNCQDVKVRNCFVRSFDDALVVKGLSATPGQPPVLNNEFSGCVIWCDWGNALKIGVETYTSQIRNVTFSDCDIIRTTYSAMEINNGDHANISDVRFENIRLSTDNSNIVPIIQEFYGQKYEITHTVYLPYLAGLFIGKNRYSQSPEFGTIQNILFKDISVSARQHPPMSYFVGADESHTISGVTFENLKFNNQHIPNTGHAGLYIDPFVYNVKFE